MPDQDTCTEHGERIVVLETELSALKTAHTETMKKLDQILSEMTRYKGFLGGMTFLLTGVGVAWSLFHGWIEKHWQ
jgi:hypothetical protein